MPVWLNKAEESEAKQKNDFFFGEQKLELKTHPSQNPNILYTPSHFLQKCLVSSFHMLIPQWKSGA